MSKNYDKLYVSLRYLLLGRNYKNALRALGFAADLHVGKRKDGTTPEFQHQVEIALFLATLKDVADEELAMTVALLHDVAEDYNTDFLKLESLFGKEVAEQVFALTKVVDGKVVPEGDYYSVLADQRTASLVKGADRVHNVQSMPGVFGFAKQEHYAMETQLHVLPMLKQARYNFPEQSFAYLATQHMLKSQLYLISAGLESQAGLRSRLEEMTNLGKALASAVGRDAIGEARELADRFTRKES